MNSIGIDVGKRKCRASVKDKQGKILDEFFFTNDSDGIRHVISSAEKIGPCRAVAYNCYRVTRNYLVILGGILHG